VSAACHNFATGGVDRVVSASSEAVDRLKAEDAATFDFEAIFRSQYERIARVIARVVRDPARAEELAVEVFLKLWRNPLPRGEKIEGWLYRAAVRRGLDELRRRTRRTGYERLVAFVRPVPTPEELRRATEEKEKVHLVLAAMKPRQAELLLLRSQSLTYDELASALELNPASVGTLLSRAEQAFRKEYIRRHGAE
jgi:RNA polymerase sigma-70 factor, ECF subfamily